MSCTHTCMSRVFAKAKKVPHSQFLVCLRLVWRLKPTPHMRFGLTASQSTNWRVYNHPSIQKLSCRVHVLTLLFDIHWSLFRLRISSQIFAVHAMFFVPMIGSLLDFLPLLECLKFFELRHFKFFIHTNKVLKTAAWGFVSVYLLNRDVSN